MNLKETRKFNISLIGDVSGEKWFGEFESYRRLTHRQQLLKDRLERDLLGANPDNASPTAKMQADMLAEIQVTLINAPEWFKSSSMGLDIVDNNVLIEIYNNVVRIRSEAIEELKQKADKAAEELKELIQK